MALRHFPPLVIAPLKTHTATVIFHHGFGATASDWASLASLSSLRPHTKLILPQAPLRKITISGGYEQPAWFDIINSSHAQRVKDGDEDEVGMRESLSSLSKLVNAEIDSGIASDRIVVGGFSQGAALALLWGALGRKCGGVVVLSGYLPLQWKILAMKDETANTLPAFWAHGTGDEVIKYSTAEAAFAKLEKAGMSNMVFNTYEGMPHGACDEEMEDLEKWLIQRIPPLEDAKL